MQQINIFILKPKTNITRGNTAMTMGIYKIAYLIKNRSAYGDFIVVGRWYHENSAESFLKHFVFEGPSLSKVLIFLKL